jgi:hypothetical protein
VNRYEDARYREHAAALESALNEWSAGIDAPVAYLDEDAPEISQSNVPKRNDGHRDEMIAYSQQKVLEYRSASKN